MGRGNTDLSSNEYDSFLASKAKTSTSAKRELEQRKIERRNAHDSEGRGWHFGISDVPVKILDKQHLRMELDKRGLMLATDVKKNLR